MCTASEQKDWSESEITLAAIALFSSPVNTAGGGLLSKHLWPFGSDDDVDAGALLMIKVMMLIALKWSEPNQV